jgi:hypothetical protein
VRACAYRCMGTNSGSYIGGSRYYVTFIDDATRKTWVYCIRKKTDVFDTFKKLKALVENETGKRLKCLRSENGGEYCRKNFDVYCSYHGIHREKRVPGTPQENGVSERMNNHEACKEYDIACCVALTILGRCCRYYCLINKHRTFKLFGWWNSRGGMDK